MRVARTRPFSLRCCLLAGAGLLSACSSSPRAPRCLGGAADGGVEMGERGGGGGGGARGRGDTAEDQPPYSRLFVVCSKQHTEDTFLAAFSKFGTIEDIRVPRDRASGESKGVAYIKFSKTSEAAKAMEEMHYKTIVEGTRSIKVMVAAGRSEVASDDDDKYKRLFLTVPKSADEESVREDFRQFGTIDSVLIQTNKATGESKGFAYVKFRRFLSAALAYEECDRKYRAIFAKPKKTVNLETSFESNINSLANQSPAMVLGGVGAMIRTPPEGYTRLLVMCSPYLTQGHIAKLFDIVPGMESCQFMVDLLRECGKATVTYSNPTSAAYAREKLDNFEYPPGQRIFVKPDTHCGNNSIKGNEVAGLVNNLKAAMCSGSAPDLAQLVETIAQASSLIKAATCGINNTSDNHNSDLNYCSVKLPPPQPLADINSSCAMRCFIVCCGQPPTSSILRDVFCRFGDLIDVYTLPNKTVGYARYASTKAAKEAIQTLHGAEICGVRLKVMEAEERGSGGGGGGGGGAGRFDDREQDDHKNKRAKFD